MNYKPIIIVAGEPNSIFFEIFFKVIKKKFKSPIILIASQKLILNQAKTLKNKINLNLINENDIIKKRIKLKKINLINVDLKQTKAFYKISSKSNEYISTCFRIALKLIKKEIMDNELVVEKSISTIPNSFDITLKNEDYTIGKIIEYVLFKNYFQNGEITYSGFRKNHPHDPDSVIRIAFDETEIETTKIYNIIDNCFNLLLI